MFEALIRKQTVFPESNGCFVVFQEQYKSRNPLSVDGICWQIIEVFLGNIPSFLGRVPRLGKEPVAFLLMAGIKVLFAVL